MQKSNQTHVTTFIIVGFSSPKSLKILFFLLFLIVYMLTIIANIIIISVVWINSRLHTPMYVFLSNFSFMEIWYTTVTVPKMMQSFLPGQNIISVKACIIQLYMFFVLGAIECLLLAVMAVDRYLAICKPLHYLNIMNSKACHQIMAATWTSGFLIPILPMIMISKLSFCGPDEIQHFFCDAAPLLKLSCSDVHTSEMLFSLFASIVALGTCLLTMVSYICIINTILRIRSSEGRQKAFSTCGSHLTVVIIYYGTVIYMYVGPAAISKSEMDKVVSVFYAVLTPLFNPIIYSLRNKEVRDALRNNLNQLRTFIAGLRMLSRQH